MVTLFLIRHADAEIQSPTGKDIDRNLSYKGKVQCDELINKLSIYDWKNVNFYVSDSKRTKQTFQLIFDSIEVKSVQYYNELYLPSLNTLLKFINSLITSEPMCIVAHNEGISALASLLSGQRIIMNTTSFIELTFDFEHSGYISENTGVIKNIIF
jgi:phosphohistidine phosphatase